MIYPVRKLKLEKQMKKEGNGEKRNGVGFM